MIKRIWSLYTYSDDENPTKFFCRRFFDHEEAEHHLRWARFNRPEKKHWLEESDLECSGDELPTPRQVRELCRLMYHAFVELRHLSGKEDQERIFDLTDLLHNLPTEMFDPAIWSWELYEKGFAQYEEKHRGRGYVSYVQLLKEIRESPS